MEDRGKIMKKRMESFHAEEGIREDDVKDGASGVTM